MPTYEYICPKCSDFYSVIASDPPPFVTCKCGQRMKRKYGFVTTGMPTRGGVRMGRGLRNKPDPQSDTDTST